MRELMRMFDDFGMHPWMPEFPNVMKMDIVERNDKHEIDIDIPGYNKGDISIELHNGMLTVAAEKKNVTEEKNDEGKVIHSERYFGKCSRQIEVGKDVTEEDIHASYNNGVLHLEITRKEKVEPEKKIISID